MRFPALIRHGAAAMLRHVRLRIRSGPNESCWWSVASAGRGALAGTFEQQRVDGLLRVLRHDDVVWDIGAHKGYVALAASRKVGAGGHVYAFEPSPENLSSLRRHVAWNDARNITVMPMAMSDADGTSRFGGGGSSITYRLGAGDDVVAVHTIASMMEQGLRAPNVLKVDVEGAEADVLRGAGDKLRHIGIVLVAVHARELYSQCRGLLEEQGFSVYRSAVMQRMMERLPTGWSADPDLLAIAPHRTVDRTDLAYFSGTREVM